MRKLEFYLLMQIANLLERKTLNPSQEHFVGRLPNIEFSFIGSYTFVSGAIPKPLISLLHKKAPSISPASWATQWKLKTLANNIDYCDLYRDIYKKEKEKIIQDSISDEDTPINYGYVSMCAYTKEELLNFLIELAKYYHDKEPLCSYLSGISHSKLPELIAEVNNKLNAAINAYIPTRDWLYGAIPSLLKEDNEHLSEQDSKIKELLRRFDGMVNPFASNLYEVILPLEYKDKIRLEFDFIGNEKSLSVISSELGDRTNYFRSDALLEYDFSRCKDNNVVPYYRMQHCFSSIDKEEHLYILSEENIVDYNLTKGTFRRNHGSEEVIDEVEKSRLILELEAAIAAVKNVTINNMCKPKTTSSNSKRIGIHPQSD